jgi:putative cardiolipin synthase
VLVSLRPLAAILLAAAAVGCRPLPSLDPRPASSAFANTADTRIGKALAARIAGHPGKSGILPLPGSLDAFAARVLLAREAERSLDVQYYIWHDDLSGRLLLRELQDAAARGVRVRLLLDDNNTTAELDEKLAALDALPNVEVRLFNPFAIRRPRWIGYLTDFSRLNRRMHNKSFTADNQATIIGGRNVGDEYFGAGTGAMFVDLDVLAVGPIARDVSADFDRYWASGSAYLAEKILPPASGPLNLQIDEPESAAYREAVRSAPFMGELLQGKLPFEWAATRMVSDDPAKVLGTGSPRELVLKQLNGILGAPKSALDLVSPYFVPAEAGTGMFSDLSRGGVKVRVLTNALEATDVAVVHSGYAKRRRALLEAGVRLYELRRIGVVAKQEEERERGPGTAGSSASSLHAKTFAVDHARIFVGSFNFDPRSAHLNTELGFVIDSPGLAGKVGDAFEKGLRANAYEVRLSDAGELYWIERRGAEEIRHDQEPGAGFLRRTLIRVLALLPIDWLL